MCVCVGVGACVCVCVCGCDVSYAMSIIIYGVTCSVYPVILCRVRMILFSAQAQLHSANFSSLWTPLRMPFCVWKGLIAFG